MKIAQLLNENLEDKTEEELRKLDWKDDPTIQSSILQRKDISENFLFDIIENLTNATSFFVKSMGTLNATIFSSSKLMNALTNQIEMYPNHINDQMYQYYQYAMETPIDKDLLVSLLSRLVNSLGSGNPKLKYIVGNVSFPEEGFDKIDEKLLDVELFIACPNIDQQRIETLIMKFINGSNEPTTDMIAEALGERKKRLRLSDKVAMAMLNNIEWAMPWFRGVIVADQVDHVLDNMEEYSNTITKDGSSQKDDIIKYLSQNRKLTTNQKRKVLAFNSTDSTVRTNILLSDPNPEPDFFEELINSGKDSIWYIWNGQIGCPYHEFDKDFVKVIDRIALSSKKKVPGGVLIQGFARWFEYNNESGNKMSEETSIKYLFHFLKYGDSILMKNIKANGVGAEWLKYKGVKEAMFKATNDSKYLYGSAKNFFYFPE